MKKLKYILLGFIIGALVCTVALAALLYMTKDSVDWHAYTEDVLLPNAVTAATTLGIIGIGVSPYLKRMLEGVAGFFSATEKVNETREQGEENAKSFAEAREQMAEELTAMKGDVLGALGKISLQLEESRAEQKTELETVERELGCACRMLDIGFTSMDELVKKGSARKIKEAEEVLYVEGNNPKEESEKA